MKKNLSRKLSRLQSGVTFGSSLALENITCDIPEVIRHYAESTLPSESLVLDGLEILGRKRFIEQNIRFSPAIFIRHLGFWTIVTTYGGDAFVLDAADGSVISVDTGMLFYDDGNPTGLGPNGREPISRDFIINTSKEGAPSLEEFFSLII